MMDISLSITNKKKTNKKTATKSIAKKSIGGPKINLEDIANDIVFNPIYP